MAATASAAAAVHNVSTNLSHYQFLISYKKQERGGVGSSFDDDEVGRPKKTKHNNQEVHEVEVRVLRTLSRAKFSASRIQSARHSDDSDVKIRTLWVCVIVTFACNPSSRVHALYNIIAPFV